MTLDLASPLLAEALAAHGGLDRWQSLRGMSSIIVTGGRLWGLKGINLDSKPRVARTDIHRQWTSIAPFGKPDQIMTWVPDRVVIENSTGHVIAERKNPRKAFDGHEYHTPWDPLHLAYFHGYAMWTYHNLPFVLAEPGYDIAEIAPINQDGKSLQGLSARFPEGVHTHSLEQRFYFGDDGLLCRHEYDVDVWAASPAVHLLSEYIEVEGLRLPTRRRVYPPNPDGSLQCDFTIVAVEMSNYILHSATDHSDQDPALTESIDRRHDHDYA